MPKVITAFSQLPRYIKLFITFTKYIYLRKIKDTAYDHYKEDMIPLIKKRKRRRSADTVSNNQIDLNTSYSHHSTVGGAHVVLEQSWSD